jgi:hypothetical protein
MSKQKSRKSGILGAPMASRWKGKASLDLVYQSNERCLKLLRDVAMTSSPTELASIARHRELWRGLDANVIERVAQFPFLILDMHFTNETWWRNVVEVGDRAAAGALNANNLPVEVAEPLTQETLIFAWHSVKWDRRVARLSLGMSSAVADIIAALSPQQIADIAGHYSSELHLRWQGSAYFWTQLLRIACSGDSDALEEIRLHAKLLFCGALI